ncbi:hypothetical protein U1700_09035 [Sphingomonas sp. RB1R13]
MRMLVILLAIVSSTSAMGQSSVTGSITNLDQPVTLSREGRFTGDEAREIGDQFATCVLNRHYAAVGKALSMPSDSEEQYAALYKILDPECWTTGGGMRHMAGGMDVEMTTNPISFRSSLFKVYVKKNFARVPLEFVAPPLSATGRNAGMVAFADCVIRLDVRTSLSLIISTAGSKAEGEAVRALRPHLNQCLAPGNTVALSKASLSSAISEAYYREARAAQLVGKR